MTTSPMQVAEILSDLTSLRACDHNDALSLVTVNERIASREGASPSASAPPGPEPETQNEDLRRAKELVDLHYEIKAKHAGGSVDEDLVRAREEVNRVLRELKMST